MASPLCWNVDGYCLYSPTFVDLNKSHIDDEKEIIINSTTRFLRIIVCVYGFVVSVCFISVVDVDLGFMVENHSGIVNPTNPNASATIP